MPADPKKVPESSGPLLRALLLGILAAPVACAAVGNYDFDGFRPGSAPSGSMVGTGGASGGDAGRLTGGGPGCLPITCDDLGAECGSAPDGCGGTIHCGQCVAPLTCGGG